MLGFIPAVVPTTALIYAAGYLGSLVGYFNVNALPPGLVGDEQIMVEKTFGTCPNSPQEPLRFGTDYATAAEMSCFSRDRLEKKYYFRKTRFLDYMRRDMAFYDSVTGKPLFQAPRGRSFSAFLDEIRHFGWPSFRDAEVVAENVRVLPNGEVVSVDGTYLGQNMPDRRGNRYNINVAAISGQPPRKLFRGEVPAEQLAEPDEPAKPDLVAGA